VVRQNMTLKNLLENTVKELKLSDIKSLSVVVNDLGPEYKRYGYGGRYEFLYGEKKNKKKKENNITATLL
jgi:hypothetical protein